MDAVIRKRITKVGSGAWSIYLPKKWIDAWTPEQQAGREVDLYTIGEAIVVAPVLADRTVSAAVDTDPKTVRRILLSAYVRGATDVTLTPAEEGHFGNDAILAARDFLRHLDERIVATAGPASIGFHINPDLPPSTAGTDAAMVLVARVQEAMTLAADAITTVAHDPERTLHTLRLLRDTVEFDIARIFYQTLRAVATIDLPVQSVSDLQLLDLTAAQLDRIGQHTRQVAAALLDLYGLQLSDLDYPTAHIQEKVRLPPIPGPVMRAMAEQYSDTLQSAAEGLAAGAAALLSRDIAALRHLQGTARGAQLGLQAGIFDAVMDAWGTQISDDERGLANAFYQLSTPIVAILGNLAAIAHHAITLTAVEPYLDIPER